MAHSYSAILQTNIACLLKTYLGMSAIPQRSTKIHHTAPLLKFMASQVTLSVPALRVFWDLEKTVLHEICVSGTVGDPQLTQKSPTCTYISQKTWEWKPWY